MNLKESLLFFLRGLFMGIADIIPGVSGGTIALITGIYERLIKAINDVNELIIKQVFKKKISKACKNILKLDFGFLIPLALGIAIAMLSLSHLMDYLLHEQTALTYAFFFGLILASAIFVYKHAGKNHWKNLIFGMAGLVLSFWIAGLSTVNASHSVIILFLSGAIAICAMILPGISGAFILVLLGQYEFIIGAIKNLMLDKIVIFGAGAVVGILAFSKLLNYLLKKHKPATMSFLTGLMLGALRKPYLEISASYGSLLQVIIVAVIGFGIVFFLERKFNK